MQKFTVTEHKTTWEYELCDSSDSSGNKCLKITQYRKGKYVDEEVVDLSEINPEFFEVQIEKKSPSRMRIPVYCAGGFIWFSSLIVFLALGSWEHMFVAVATWMIPPIIGWRLIISSQYAVKPRFYFGEQDIPKITVPYTDKKRPETLQFVQTIASFCHQKRNAPKQLPVMKHHFANGLAELRDIELVLFNKYGIKSTACTYDEMLPKLIHNVEKHTIRNVFCISIAVFLWMATLTFLIAIAVSAGDWAIFFSFGLICFVPFMVGAYLITSCKKSQDYYKLEYRNDDEFLAELGIWQESKILLEVGENPGGEKEFIRELKNRLRNANENKSKTPKREHSDNCHIQQIENSQPTPIGTMILRWLLEISIVAESIYFLCFTKMKISVRVWLVVLTALALALFFESLNNWLVRRKEHKDK